MKKLICIFVCLLLVSCNSPLNAGQNEPWETIHSNEVDTYRMFIPHGWIVVTKLGTGNAMAYIPDEKHEWKIN